MTFRAFHKWLGLIIGPLVLVVAISGIYLVYWKETAPQFMAATAQAAPVTADDVPRILAREFPGARILSLRLPDHVPSYFRAQFGIPQDGKIRRAVVDIDESTGALREVDTSPDTFATLVYNLHVGFGLGETGLPLLKAVGVAFLVLVGTGLAVWWPNGRSFIRALAPSGFLASPNRLRRIHRLLGVYVFLVLFVVTVSGLVLVFRNEISALFGSDGHPSVRTMNTGNCGKSASISGIVDLAEARFPFAKATHIRFPSRPGRPAIVSLRHAEETPTPLGLTKVYVDPVCLTATHLFDGRTATIGDTFVELAVALHSGRYFGAVGRLFVLLSGVVVIGLFMSAMAFVALAPRRKSSR